MRLVVSHIGKAYDGKTVLVDCSTEFGPTGVSVLMGGNGSGKSTLLRICSLLESPDKGSISFFSNDQPLTQDLVLRRRMTLVLARTGVFNTTVFRNVAYGLKIRGVQRAEIEQKVRKALDFVGLSHLRDRRAVTLSSGETQRLGIARALAIDPEILFLDEPTASVDQENTEIIESIITTMKKEERTTVIMTTHDRDQAERLGDRLLLIREGRLVETSPHHGARYER
jgi:tungstate transport system ATP-binding protein